MAQTGTHPAKPANLVEFAAKARQAGGTRAARILRHSGRVPAIVYGPGGKPLAISFDRREIERYARRPAFMSSPCFIVCGKEKIRALPRVAQRDPVYDSLLHIDFFRLHSGASINVQVPVQFLNEEESPGLKRGGILNIIRHEVELACPADKIPEHITANLAGLDIGDSIHISHITLPEGIAPVISDRDFTIASVVAPAAVRGQEAEEAEAAEEKDEEDSETKEESSGESA